MKEENKGLRFKRLLETSEGREWIKKIFKDYFLKKSDHLSGYINLFLKRSAEEKKEILSIDRYALPRWAALESLEALDFFVTNVDEEIAREMLTHENFLVFQQFLIGETSLESQGKYQPERRIEGFKIFLKFIPYEELKEALKKYNQNYEGDPEEDRVKEQLETDLDLAYEQLQNSARPF